jgi:uncharacterized protein YdhG (YjbR/CyaY superfamily)
MARPATIDEYLARLPAEQRAALTKIRKAIVAAAPNATEGFSYGLPAFRDADGLLAGFGASTKHCAYYPMSGSVVAALASELERYETSKGAIRFDAAKPLPATLVRKLVRARQAESARPAAKEPAVKKPAPRPAVKKPAPRLAVKRPPAMQKAASAAARTDPAVAAYMLELDHPLKAELASVRRIILGVSPEIGESIKWKVPSFRTPKDYFATLHVRSTESVQVVLHLGAKVRPKQEQIRLPDPSGLLTWLGKDRAMVTLGTGRDITKNRGALAALVRAWLALV